jgi:large subunit ribosomal protein L23
MPTKLEVIVRPLITEKTSAARVRGEYAFEVHPTATKGQIRQAIQDLFKVNVTDVWTANVRGKEKRMGRTVGRRPAWKKAIVKLKDGETIEGIFEG